MLTNNRLFFAISLVIFVMFLGVYSQTPSPDPDTEIQQLKERIKKLEEIKALRAKAQALQDELDGKVTAKPTPEPTVKKTSDQTSGSGESGSGTVIASPTPSPSPAKNDDGCEIPTALKNLEDAFSTNHPDGIKSDINSKKPGLKLSGDTLCAKAVANDLIHTFTKIKDIQLNLADQKSKDFLRNILVSKLIRQDIADTLVALDKEKNLFQSTADSRTSEGSVITKPTIPGLLSFAVENGAVQQATSGATITFRANPGSLLKFLAGGGSSALFPKEFQQVAGKLNLFSPKETLGKLFTQDDQVLNQLNKFEIALSFDTSRGVETPQFTGTRQQLASYSIKYNFFNQRNPLGSNYWLGWNTVIEDAKEKFDTEAKKVIDEFLQDTSAGKTVLDPKLKEWVTETNALMKSAADGPNPQDKIQDILIAQFAKMPLEALANSSRLQKAMENLRDAKRGDDRRKILNQMSGGHILSFEYSNFREVNAPDRSTFKGLYSKKIGVGDFTINGAFTMFHKSGDPTKIKPGTEFKRIRDIDIGLEGQFPIRINGNNLFDKSSDDNLLSSPILSFAAKYQRRFSDIFQPDGTLLPNTKGNVILAQLKLLIPINLAGLRFNAPFSFTFSNRKDLLNEQHIFGNFGTTFDYSPFSAWIKDNLKLPK